MKLLFTCEQDKLLQALVFIAKMYKNARYGVQGVEQTTKKANW